MVESWLNHGWMQASHLPTDALNAMMYHVCPCVSILQAYYARLLTIWSLEQKAIMLHPTKHDQQKTNLPQIRPTYTSFCVDVMASANSITSYQYLFIHLIQYTCNTYSTKLLNKWILIVKLGKILQYTCTHNHLSKYIHVSSIRKTVFQSLKSENSTKI